jgi:hypothetical protein
MKSKVFGFITVFTTIFLATPLLTQAADVNSQLADFEGSFIDLSKDWGEAKACWSDGRTTECFRTESQMDSQINQRFTLKAAAVTCATSVKLYSNTSYGGSVLSLVTRTVPINLSAYGFDNLTSSYVIGSCNALFYDYANNVSPTYPGATTANSSAASMLTGWDNRVSSIRIS